MFKVESEIIKIRETKITVDKDIQKFCQFLYAECTTDEILDILDGIISEKEYVKFEDKREFMKFSYDFAKEE